MMIIRDDDIYKHTKKKHKNKKQNEKQKRQEQEKSFDMKEQNWNKELERIEYNRMFFFVSF